MIGKFRSKDVFEIRHRPGEGDDPDDWKFKKPIISFGLVKAKAILKFIDEIRAFVEAHE